MTNWTLKAIDVMHLAKDTMRGQLDQTTIDTVIANLKTFKAASIGMDIPLNDPSDYPAPQPLTGYTEKWLSAIRGNGLKVEWRGSFLDFEAIYDMPKATPTGSPSRALGTAANVFNGLDTSSYLYLIWIWVKTHGTWFEAGDSIGPCPEPENQGVGAGTSNMFASHAELGQWLVDIKTVVDDALENTLGFSHGDILTGMTSINGGTVETNQVGASFITQIGRLVIDHYIPSGTYSSSLDTIHTNSGVDEIYIGEYGTTGGVGAPASDLERSQMIEADFATFASKSYIKGVSYWQAVGGSPTATERLLDDQNNYVAYPLSQAVIQNYFTPIPPVVPPVPPDPIPDPDPEIPFVDASSGKIGKHQIIIKDKAGNVVGQISDWFNLKFSDQLNGYGQATFAIPIDSSDATKLISLRRYEVDITENGVVVWSGEQVNADVAIKGDDANLVTITCYTYLEMLNARYTPEYIRYDQIDQALILKALVDDSQAKTDGDFGFSFANITPTMNRDREYKLDNIMESFINMSNVINGIDFWIDYNKVIHFGAPRRGNNKSNQFGFEWKVNVQEMQISDNFASPANTAYAIGSADGVNPMLESFADSQARTTYKLREQTVSAIDVSDVNTLIGKAEDLVNNNKRQHRTLKITQLPNTTPSLRDLNLGDYINARIKKGRYDINSPFRILGYECVVGEVGESNITWIISDFQSEV